MDFFENIFTFFFFFLASIFSTFIVLGFQCEVNSQHLADELLLWCPCFSTTLLLAVFTLWGLLQDRSSIAWLGIDHLSST